MTVPKQRHTKSRRNKRRMNIFLEKPTLTVCPKCKKPVKPHMVCFNCGSYKGKEFIDVLKKLNKKERKLKEKEIAAEKEEKSEKKPLNWEGLSKK
jgi:large subunit ribosomal protein L32